MAGLPLWQVTRAATRSSGSSVAFVLVGGAHLIGDDGVLVRLRHAGIEPQRVA